MDTLPASNKHCSSTHIKDCTLVASTPVSLVWALLSSSYKLAWTNESWTSVTWEAWHVHETLPQKICSRCEQTLYWRCFMIIQHEVDGRPLLSTQRYTAQHRCNTVIYKAVIYKATIALMLQADFMGLPYICKFLQGIGGDCHIAITL